MYASGPACPPAVVTVTATTPGPAAAGALTATCVGLTLVTVAWFAPNITVTPAIELPKFVPVITTLLPPATGPFGGTMPVAVGTATYVYGSGPLVPLGVETLTLTVPGAAPAGATTVICPLLTLSTLPALPPNATFTPST